MEFDPILIPPRRGACIAAGLWRDRTINDDLDDCVALFPDKVALTAVQVDGSAPTSFTYREMATMTDRIAVGLARLGVGRNDVVSCQLPNSWQLTVLCLACARIGAVINPLMHIFRERELSFMLRHAGAKLIIAPKSFRGFDFEAMLTALQPSLPALRHVIAVGGSGANSFDALLSAPAWEQANDARAILTSNRPAPDDVMQLIYTSGTTGEPKGVMHSANTTMSNISAYAARMRLGADDVVLMASPMTHQTGFMYGLMMPIMLKASAVLQDAWDPVKAVQVIRDYGATFTMASTPFLADLATAVAQTGTAVPTLRTFVCAGAPIPGPLIEKARSALGTKIVSAWGMSENGAVTMTALDDDDERSIHSDGFPLPGVEIKVVDDGGHALPAGVSGQLMLRSCSNFGGYLHRPQLNATDAGGWFDTGDKARIDERGYVRITGRSKDVIIRGGENIPVIEIETLLYRHPAVATAVIIAYPDKRLGERACAIVVARPGHSIDLASMVAFLKEQKVATPYIPERLIVRDAMPTTPTGKIQKFRLREMLANGEI